MRKLGMVAVALAIMLFVSLATMAQDEQPKPEPAKVSDKPANVSWYKLDLHVSEFDGAKKLNTREFTITTSTTKGSNLKVGSRMPVSMGEKGIVYLDTGLYFNRLEVTDTPDGPQLRLMGDLSGVTTELGANGNPIIRSMDFDCTGILAPGKPTLLVSWDDVNSTHRFQIEVTATKLK